MDEVRIHQNFVFASVKGDYGKDIVPLYKYAVLIDVPITGAADLVDTEADNGVEP